MTYNEVANHPMRVLLVFSFRDIIYTAVSSLKALSSSIENWAIYYRNID